MSRDVVIKQGIIIKFIDDNGDEKTELMDKYLPIDRVVTLDGNGVVYLYDTRIKVEENMIERDLLNKYHTINQLKTSFDRMDRRLSPRLLQRETASSYSNAVVDNINYLEKDFLEFFPELCKTVKSDLDKEKLKHWRL